MSRKEGRKKKSISTIKIENSYSESDTSSWKGLPFNTYIPPSIGNSLPFEGIHSIAGHILSPYNPPIWVLVLALSTPEIKVEALFTITFFFPVFKDSFLPLFSFLGYTSQYFQRSGTGSRCLKEKNGYLVLTAGKHLKSVDFQHQDVQQVYVQNVPRFQPSF